MATFTTYNKVRNILTKDTKPQHKQMVSKDFIYRIKLEVNIQKVKLNCGNTFKKNSVKGKTNLKLYYFRKKD